MKKVLKKVLFPAALFTGVLFFTSCPQPLTEDDVVAAQDKLAPTIEILSPGENEVYYSEVEFSLRILDDAEKEEDGQGDLASISFELANDDLRGGRAVIDAAGKLTQDSSYGPDEVLYDPTTGLVSFSFSTVSPNTVTGIISVTVSAEDRNGNLTTENMTLADNEGPWVDFTIVDTVSGEERSYTEDTTVRLSGTIGNSAEDQNSDNEITSITWSVLGKSWNGQLVLDPDATYVDPDTANTLSYYNASQSRYERLNEGVAYPELFMYYPASRTFRTDLEIPFGAGSVLPFEVTVTDKNGHETTMTVNAFSDESGPEVVIEFPRDETAYYSMNTGVSHDQPGSDIIQGYINGGIGDLQSFKVELKDSTGDFSSGKIDLSPGIGVPYDAFDTGSTYNASSNEFYIDISQHLSLMENEASVAYTGGTDVTVIIYAVNDDDFETRPKVIIDEDADGPAITAADVHFASTGSPDSAYANSGSTLEMSFAVTDASTDAADLTVVSQTLGGDTSALDSKGNTYSFSSATAWKSGMTSDADLTYNITLEDRLGNQTVLTQGTANAPQIMYYDGAPTYGTHLSFTADGPDAHEGFIAQGEQLDIVLTSTRDLQTPVVSNLSVKTASMGSLAADSISPDSGTPMNVFTASYTPGASSVDEEELSLVMSLTDMAGNPMTVPAEVPTAYYYDSVAPNPPSTPNLNSADDTYHVAASLGSNSDGKTKNTTDLTIEGTAEADSTVSIFINGLSSPEFTATADGSGNWSDDIVSPVNNGIYQIVARTVDQAGNESSSSGVFNLQIMTALPSDPTGIDLRTASDSSRPGYGAGSTDNITNIESVYIDGTAPVGSYMVLSVDGTAQSYTTANSLGNWSKNVLLGSGDKTYALEVKTADVAGNESSGSETLDIVLDNINNTSSTITLSADDDTGFQDNDGFTKLASGLTFTGDLSYGAGDDQELYSSYGVSLSGVITPDLLPTYSISNVSAGVASDTWSADMALDADDGSPSAGEYEGEYTISVATIDAAGNTSGSVSNFDLVFDKTLPTGSSVSGLDLLTASDSGIDNSDDYTNDDTPGFQIANVISAAADKNLFSNSVSDLIYLDLMAENVASSETATIGTTSFSGDYNGASAITAGTVSDGEYYLTVAICDRAGNVSTPSIGSGSDTFNSTDDILTIDTANPVSAFVSELSLRQNTIYDTGYAQDDGKTNRIGTLIFDYILSSYDSEDYYLELSSSEEGAKGSALVAIDGSGNGSITSSSGFSTIGTGHTVSVNLYDRAGNLSDANASNVTDTIIVNTDTPSVDLTLSLSDDSGFSSSDYKTNNVSQTLTFGFSSNLTEDSYVLYNWEGSDVKLLGSSGDASLSFNDTTLTTNTLTATLYDIFGNASTGTAVSESIVLNTDQPAGGSIDSYSISSDSGVSGTDLYTNVEDQTITFNLSGINEDSYMELDFTPDGGTLTTFTSSATFNFTSTSGSGNVDSSLITLVEGNNNQIAVRLYDIYGNAYQAITLPDSGKISLDTTDPVTDISNLALHADSDLGIPSDNKTSDTGVLKFSFDLSTTSFENPTYIELQSDKETPQTLQIGEYSAGGSDLTILSSSGMAYEGSHTISATIYDKAGNVSSGTSSDNFTLITDYTAPELTSSMISVTSEGGDDTLTFNLDENLNTEILSGTGVVGSFEDFTDITFDTHVNFTDPNPDLSLKGKISSGGLLEIAAFSGSTRTNFPDGTDYVINFGSTFTDEAGNRVQREGISSDLNSMQFDYDSSASVTVDSQSGVSSFVAYQPSIEAFSNTSELLSSGYTPLSLQEENRRVHMKDTVSRDSDLESEKRMLQRSASLQSEIIIPEPVTQASVTPAFAPAALPPQIEYEYNVDTDALAHMEDVNKNRIDRNQLLTELRAAVPREKLLEMERFLEPEIPELEELVLYSSPVPNAFETPVTLSAETTVILEDETPSGLILLTQILLAAAIGLLTIGFIKLLGRNQRKDYDPLD